MDALKRLQALPEELRNLTDPDEWAYALDDFHSKVVGLVACSVGHAPDVLQYLNGTERHVLDFWQCTAYLDDPVVFFEVKAAANSRQAVAVHDILVSERKTSIFFMMTPASLDPLLPQCATPGDTWQTLVQSWCMRHNGGNPFDNVENNELPLLNIVLPTPHALLVVHGSWKNWGFPVPSGRQRAHLRLNLFRPFWQGLSLPSLEERAVCQRVQAPDFSIEMLQQTADLLRNLLLRIGPDDPRGEIVSSIRWLQSTRDLLVASSARRSRFAYDLATLVLAMVSAGYLRDSGDLRTVCEYAIRLAVPVPSLRDYLLGILRQGHTVPSRTVLYRHRLTVSLAVCRVLALHNTSLLNDPDGIVSWATMDSSPQGGYDWVLCGITTLSLRDAQRAFDISLELCTPALDNDEAASKVADLQSMLHLRQGVPTAVGSGRATIRHKTHAFLHALRLQCDSWPHVIGLTDSILSYTGDLGTEQRVVELRCKLTDLFGDWIVHDSEHTDDGERDDADDDHFDVMAEGREHVAEQVQNDDFEFEIEGDGANRIGNVVQARPGDVKNLMFDGTRSVFIAGTLHIVHGCVKDLGDLLVHYNDWVRELSQATE